MECLKVSIHRFDDQRQQVAPIASNEGKAMTLLLIDDQIQSDQRRLENLQERLEVQMEQERDQLQDALSDYQCAQQNEQQTIATLVAKGRAMQHTRAVNPPTQPPVPVNPNKRQVLALGFVLAGILGVLAAGVSGQAAAARRRWSAQYKP